MNFIKKGYEAVFGSFNSKTMKEIQPVVQAINTLESDWQKLSDAELQAKTSEFKNRLQAGETLDQILPEAFATVREVAHRTMKMRHYDVQLIGGIALHRGMIAEMRTGEGKTLVATLPAYLNALAGKGVHVITVNDYLAKRDAVWMGPIYDFLGLSIGIVQNQRVSYVYDKSLANVENEQLAEGAEVGSYKVQYNFLRTSTRQQAYQADITYGTNNEIGFDYLRDNMVQETSQMVMRPGSEMSYALVDEIDSILIDEARTPLIISAPAEDATDEYQTFARLVKQLNTTTDYNVDEKLRSATLTEEGIKKLEQALGVDNIYAEGGFRTVHHIEQALKGEVLFRRDKEYVVENNEVVIIDEFTGRKMPGRRYSEGLHQAIEAKEGVKIQQESRTLATITFQNLFRMYGKLAGMTGTAVTEEDEFRSIYALDVLVIPTNKPDIRLDRPDRIYKTELAKFRAVVEQVKLCRAKGQPILIGTISVEKNEMLSQFLTANGIEHNILNAKNHEREGEIIASAGRYGAVTLATNMAGRGVDIKLGGVDATVEEKEKVRAAGGLFVLGTERHESRRIDNQLRGRAARQGDPGETHFYVSTEDDLMRIFAGDRLKAVMTTLKVPDDMPIEQVLITKMLENAQKKVETHNFDIRKHLLSYDDILNKQRHIIYGQRRSILDLDPAILKGDSTEVLVDKQTTRAMILGMIEREIETVVSFHTNSTEESGSSSGDWNVNEIYETVRTIFDLTEQDKATVFALCERNAGKLSDVEARDKVVEFLFKRATEEYEKIEKQVGESNLAAGNPGSFMVALERQILLRAMDNLWVDHLVAMDYLRTGIGLRGYGQRDPLIEYKKESFEMFHTLLREIEKEVVYSFYKIGLGLQIAPSIMADDKLVLKSTSQSEHSSMSSGEAGMSASDKKMKMTKKERRKMKGKG